MRRTAVRLQQRAATAAVASKRPPLISIKDATFYRHHPSSSPPDAIANPPLFPGLNFELEAEEGGQQQHWAVLSPSTRASTTLLQVLRGQHVVVPPTARSFPYLTTAEIAAKDPKLRNPSQAIQYVGFDAERGGLGGAATKGAYLSARYESYRDETDFSVLDYLRGNTELNASDELREHVPEVLLDQVMKDLDLGNLVDMPVSSLSNGQTRRARIAKALVKKPELLLLDGPFMGLDPRSSESLSALLRRLAETSNPRLILSLRPQDALPVWITHFALMGKNPKIGAIGPKAEVMDFLRSKYIGLMDERIDTRMAYAVWAQEQGNVWYNNCIDVDVKDIREEDIEERLVFREIARHMQQSCSFDTLEMSEEEARRFHLKRNNFNNRLDQQNMYSAKTHLKSKGLTTPTNLFKDGSPVVDLAVPEYGEPVVEMAGVKVQYGDKVVLGGWKEKPDKKSKNRLREGLYWEVRRGQRWGVFGPNGSGKTTLLSLITSDHPQTYSQPIKLFGRSRLASPGEPGLSIFDLQSRIGHSSPEVHAYFPKHLSIRRVLESSFADTPLSKPRLNATIDARITSALRWFQAELHPTLGATKDQYLETMRHTNEFRRPPPVRHWILEVVDTRFEIEETLEDHLEWADQLRFSELSFSAQRVALFLRAIIHEPDLIILDEAFSGMDEMARDKCLLFLNHGETKTFRYVDQYYRLQPFGPKLSTSDLSRLNRVHFTGLKPEQAMIAVAHNREEVPGSVREWLFLPEAGTGERPRVGRLSGALGVDIRRWWMQVWDGDETVGEMPIQKFVTREYNHAWGNNGTQSGKGVPEGGPARGVRRGRTPITETSSAVEEKKNTVPKLKTKRLPDRNPKKED